MQDRSRVYIGLGSNIGNRLEHLQAAIDAIHYEIGSIIKISSCYQTPALGFDGDPFLNACIEVRTYLSPELLMSKLLQLEENQGRKRLNNGQYNARTIDLDILFYDNNIVENKLLSILHPFTPNITVPF